MKHFRRKRTTSTTSPPPSNPPSISISTPGPLAPTPQPDVPLYARFTNRGPEGTGSKPVVSGPITLVPRRAGQVPVPVPAVGPPPRGSSPQKERQVVREEWKGTSGREELVMEQRISGRAKEDEVRGRQGEKEVKRMPSNGEALLGRSGERVEGERVLLPARKRTVKRVGDEKEDTQEVWTKEIIEVRPKKDTSPVRDRVLDEPLSSPDERVLLPARKVTQKRAEDAVSEWPREAQRAEASSPVKESKPGEGMGGAEQPRIMGPRALVPPPRTVSRKKSEVRGDVNAASTSGRTLDDSRPRATHQEPTFTSSPASGFGPAHHGSASTRAVVIGSPSSSEGWEDKFSTPKRQYGNTVVADESVSPSGGKPWRPLPDPFNPSNRPTGTQKQTTSSSNVSSAAAAPHESSSSVSTPRDLEDRPRVVGDRVLLPARKITLRHAQNSSEPDAQPERGRTLSSKRHTRLSRDVGSDVSVASSGLIVASTVSAPSTNLSYADGNRAIPEESRVLPEVATPPLARPDASYSQLPPTPPPKSEFTTIGPKAVFPGSRPVLERAGLSEGETASNVSCGSGTTATTSNVTSKSSSNTATETNGRPPRRRKYSLLAAFGLPMSRTTSESETSGGHTMQQSTKTPAATPWSAPSPSPPPLSVPSPSRSVPDTLLARPIPAASSSTDSGAGSVGESRQRLASAAGRSLPDVQVHSLHLSGFDFPLDALLTEGQKATDDTSLAPISAQPPQSPQTSKRRSLAIATSDSPPTLASSPDPDPAAAASRKPASVSASPSPSQNSNSRALIPNSPPSAPPRKTSPIPVDLPAREAPEPAPAQKLGANPTSRGINPDHSLLSPESDTRYPLPRRSSTNQSSRSRPHKSSPHPNDESPSRSSPTHSSPGKHEASSMLPAPTQRGPTQGRPLIFAAMAAAEAEAEIINPKAWMAIATAEMQVLGADERPVQTEHSNGSSQFVNGYPTPRSSSPRLPTMSPEPRQESRSAVAMGGSIGEPSAVHWAKEQRIDPRHPLPSYPQTPPTLLGNVRAPKETQSPRQYNKLSKSRSRVSRMTEASQPVTQPHLHSHSNGHTPSTLGAKPPTPVEDAPPVRTRDGPSKGVAKLTHASSHGALPAPSATSLGSPFQMRSEKARIDRHPSEASRSPPPRVISSESPVPSRPVKVLTERQMEKLSATKGLYGDALNGGHSSQRRHEQPPPIKSPPAPHALPPTPDTPHDEPPILQASSSEGTNRASSRPTTPPQTHHEDSAMSTPEKVAESEPSRSPSSPEEYARARSQRRGKVLEKDRPEGIENVTPAADPEPEEPKEPTFYPLEKHIAEATLFGQLLGYLSFGDWLALSSVNKSIRTTLYQNRDHTERVLERYLRVVGYTCWAFSESEPLALTLADLNAYMHGVSVPAHQFSRYAETYLEMKGRREWDAVQSLAAACRAFTRVVLRLRAQAEAEARVVSAVARDRTRSPLRGWGGSTTSLSHVSHQHAHLTHKSPSRSSSRAPSPTSMFSRSHHGHPGHSRNGSWSGQVIHRSQSVVQFHGPGQENGPGAFQSPLFRLRRAPLLQVCVPSPEGDWLSDASVLECEQELKRAGVLHLLRPGDVVWDTAVGDEGNVGRLVWDGSYLIDLDYAYSRAGDLPKYLPTLAFPPSYFHRVIRTMGSGNPICHVDISPWGEEIAANLQLLQDRIKTETPQGGHHMVVRWVHRSSFTIRPASSGKPVRISVPKGVGPGPSPGGAWLVDPGWLGTVVVEAEGTNEGLADLQDRCRGAFPARAMGANPILNVSPERAARMEERRGVFRILRERSRPGEIWIKTVTDKERLLPP